MQHNALDAATGAAEMKRRTLDLIYAALFILSMVGVIGILDFIGKHV